VIEQSLCPEYFIVPEARGQGGMLTTHSGLVKNILSGTEVRL